MKKTVLLLGILLAAACGKQVIEKPDNLIDKDKMADIIYDLAILDAMRSQMPAVLETNGINANTYVYKKYGIDSLQFAQSNQYYASDIESYKKIYEKVSKRLEDQNVNKPQNPDAGIVR